jgi:hypothetical protein
MVKRDDDINDSQMTLKEAIIEEITNGLNKVAGGVSSAGGESV